MGDINAFEGELWVGGRGMRMLKILVMEKSKSLSHKIVSGY